jgi:hypothetical protein
MMRDDELMTAESGSLNDQSAAMRASEEGLEWEVLTGPPANVPRPDDAGSGRADALSS